MDRNGEKLSVEVRLLTKSEVESKILDIASLRIRIFRDFPYIYDGSVEYEVKYLGRYLKTQNAKFIGAFSEAHQLVGVATCLPLNEEDDFVKTPFVKAGFKPEEVFYFGESVLLPEFRGQGLGHKFFDEREKSAQEFGSKFTSFCAVSRPANHPLKPQGYRSLDEFWKSRGYEKQNQLISKFKWKDLDQGSETEKEMIYWMRSWK